MITQNNIFSIIVSSLLIQFSIITDLTFNSMLIFLEYIYFLNSFVVSSFLGKQIWKEKYFMLEMYMEKKEKEVLWNDSLINEPCSEVM